MMLIFPDAVSDSVRQNLAMCAGVLIPSLFVFIVLGEVFSGEKAFMKLSAALRWISRPFGFGGEGAVVFLLGAMCGFPYGAKSAVDLYKRSQITKKQFIIINCCCNNVSLSFVIGVASGYVDNAIIIYTSVMTSALICAVIENVWIKEYDEYIDASSPGESKTKGLSEAVASAALVMLNICACVVFFGTTGNFIASFFNGRCSEIIKGIFEFSSGILSLSKKNHTVNEFLVCAFLSFGGLSVHAQVSCITGKYRIYRYFLIFKLFQTFFAVIIIAVINVIA